MDYASKYKILMAMNGSSFHYRYWLNGGSRIYVLEGLRDYMTSKKCQSVTFYRVEPGGKVVMGQLQRYGLSLLKPALFNQLN
ncbi:hypothetical protein AAHA92_06112 [Salvia divinorum]|uniref:Uncharacterized protein n=1 Tax=Salvia divinorum TaxID=28513 RepID=A0ABD1I5R8_SALDI